MRGNQILIEYKFSNNQINNYVQGLLYTPTKISTDVVKTSNTPYANNRPNDNGIGYEVKSLPGYYQQTAFATLPNVYKKDTEHTSAYLFYTVYGTMYSIDVGLWYGKGWDGLGWRGCYLADGRQEAPDNHKINGLSAGSRVYLIGTITDNGFVRCRILDAVDFSKVHYDYSYYVGNKVKRSTGIFNRQISLCNSDRKYTTGEFMTNAKFDEAYLYSDNGYYRTGTDNSEYNRTGAFGTNNTNRTQVRVNSYSKWYSEDISIQF